MRRWLVTVPVAGSITVEVDAETEEEAIRMAVECAFDDVTCEGFDEMEAYDRFCTGNVIHVPTNEIEAEDLGEVKEEEP